MSAGVGIAWVLTHFVYLVESDVNPLYLLCLICEAPLLPHGVVRGLQKGFLLEVSTVPGTQKLSVSASHLLLDHYLFIYVTLVIKLFEVISLRHRRHRVSLRGS